MRWLYKSSGDRLDAIAAIARRYELSNVHASRIIHGLAWMHVVNDFNKLEPLPVVLTPEELSREKTTIKYNRSDLTSEQVQRIRALRNEGMSLIDLSSEFELVESTLSNICRRFTHKDVTDADSSILSEDDTAACKQSAKNARRDWGNAPCRHCHAPGGT